MRDVSSRRRAAAEEARAVLGSLQGGPAEIAGTMARQGVTGVPRNTRGCAVARYLNANLGGHAWVHSVTVGADRVLLRPTRRWERGVSLALPEAVREFIAAFDRGEFPDLEVAAREGRAPAPAEAAQAPSS